MKNAMNFGFIGRKPSKAQVLAKAKQLEAKGANFISILWGENWMDLTQDTNGNWTGLGWIKDIGGDWVARELNHCPRKAFDNGFGNPIKFLNDHFTVISIK
jgi:hypothetical protein